VTDRLTKAEKRELRQADKSAVRQAKAVKFAASIEPSEVKQIKIAPIEGLGDKAVKTAITPRQEKSVFIPNQQELTKDCNLTWCTTHADIEGTWSWKETRAWSDEEWANHVHPTFKGLEKSTWYELEHVHKVPAKGGRHVPKNHSQEVSTLVDEAKNRWVERGLEEYDTAFRFRFGGTIRAWGIKLSGHFYLVWWERYHQIYPVGH
jgi:hypothetical protein